MKSVLTAPLSALLLAACGSAPIEGLDPVAAPAAPECEDALCLTATSKAALTQTQEALAACAPDAEQRNDPSGLRVAGIRLEPEGAEGRAALIITLANISSHGVYSYPTAGLSVDQGPVAVFGLPNAEQTDIAVQPFYGILPCDAQETRFELTWSDAGRAELSALAMDELGRVAIQTLPFTLNR